MDVEELRSDLTALRKTHGAASPIGHRCSNLLEMLENYGKTTHPDARRHLAANMERQIADLSALRRGNRG